MFARNVLLVFALCATTTVFAVPISVSSPISFTPSTTSDTQLLSSATPYAQPPSSATIAETALPGETDNDFHASGLGPIFRDGKTVGGERVPAPLGLVHPPAITVVHKRLAMAPLGNSERVQSPPTPEHWAESRGPDSKRWIVDGVLSEGHINQAFSEAGLDIAIEELALQEELYAVLSKLSPEQLRTLLSVDAVAALLSKMALDKVHVGDSSSAPVDKEATAASALASLISATPSNSALAGPTSATLTKAARGSVPSSR